MSIYLSMYLLQTCSFPDACCDIIATTNARLWAALSACESWKIVDIVPFFWKVGSIPTKNLGEVLHHEVSLWDAGSLEQWESFPNSQIDQNGSGLLKELWLVTKDPSLPVQFSCYICFGWCLVLQHFFCLVLDIGFGKTGKTYLTLFLGDLGRYASEHGPHGSTKELSKKEMLSLEDQLCNISCAMLCTVVLHVVPHVHICHGWNLGKLPMLVDGHQSINWDLYSDKDSCP
jgi:hypothetical protein